MPRIPESELERLKQEVSLLRLIQSQGHSLTKRGKDWVMRCVFHEDATASLVVTESKNLYHCFGCGAAGSVMDWVMKTQGVSLPHAVQFLKTGAPLEGERLGVARSQVRHLPPLVAASTATDATPDMADTATEQALLRQVVDSYHANLKTSPEALAYLAARGLNHPELIDHFQLGYANKSLTYRLPPTHTQGGRAIRGQLQALGVLRESGHEHLNGCLVVPIMGIEGGSGVGGTNPQHAAQPGQVLQLYGRRIVAKNKLLPGQSPHLNLSRPLQGVFNEAALLASKEIILCEGLIDAMTFWCAGYRNVIATLGAGNFTADHRQALKHHGTRRVLIAYDRDDAGNAAADKLSAELMAAGIECFRVLFPKGMDANEYAQKVQPAAKSLGLVLQQAQWLGKGKPAQATSTPATTPASVSAEALPPPPAPPKPKPAAKEKAPAEPPSLAAVCAPELPPLPAAPAIDTAVAPQPNSKGELLVSYGDRHWRIRGWQKNLAPEQMRVNALVRREATEKVDAAYYVDTFDVYSAKQRGAYVKAAATELGVVEDTLKRDLGQLLLKLESLQDAAIQEALAPKNPAPVLSEADTQAALALLQSPDLINRITADMAACGVVGESSNLLTAYLAAVSRKLDAPLAVLIQSSSAAGKSSLMDAVLNLVPEEERIQYSAMTGQSLFYLGESDLQHKILAIAEEEGVRQAAYALKLLQSDGELTIASTGKDDTTGNLVTKQYTVKGPVMLMLTTTAIDVDEELLNRCLVLTVNESREQTQAIHARQRHQQTLQGLLGGSDKQRITALHQNAQRLLRAVHVVNPYANQLTFLSDKTRMRRDHMKYLTLIRAIALLHQHQRPTQTVHHHGKALAYIEVAKSDIELANRLAHEMLGRTLDELPPQTRSLLRLMHTMVKDMAKTQNIPAREVRFTRREVREATRWSDNQLKVHCTRLSEMEYLLTHGGTRGHYLQYELLYDGQDGNAAHLMGLIDPAELDNDARKLGQEERKLPSSWPQVAPELVPSWTPTIEAAQGLQADLPETAQNALPVKTGPASSLAAAVV